MEYFNTVYFHYIFVFFTYLLNMMANMIEDVCDNMFVLDNMILFLQVNMCLKFWNSEFNIFFGQQEWDKQWTCQHGFQI